MQTGERKESYHFLFRDYAALEPTLVGDLEEKGRRLLYATTIVQLPLAFVRSGYVNVEAGYMNYSGWRGYNWLRTVTAANACNFYFTNTVVAPSVNSPYYYGYSPRWL